MTTRLLMKSVKYWTAAILAVVWLAALAATGAQAQGKSSGVKIRLATPSASLSYLPIHVALQKGFFARGGFDFEVIQMAAGLVAPAMLSSTASLKADVTAGSIFDFSLAAEAARELAQKK
jgi:ABC-type nitrate/sulfonate/bicarbonate transport system substrate-binding protein